MLSSLTPRKLLNTLQTFAIYDVLLMPDWDLRYFSFNANWDPALSEMMGSVRDGQNMEAFFHFSSSGVVGKILDDNLRLNDHAQIDSIPEKFSSFKSEEAFSLSEVTFFLWNESNVSPWQFSPKVSMLPEFFSIIIGGTDAYCAWAEIYYGKQVESATLSKALKMRKISNEMLDILDCKIRKEDIQAELDEILGAP